MTLYDLVNSAIVQGDFIELKVFDSDRNEVKSESFEYVDDLTSFDIYEYEDMEIIFVYAVPFVRYYPSETKNCACLVIELEKRED